MTAALSIHELQKSIRVGFFAKKIHLLRGISLEIQQGHILGFVGQNGAGKSTTLKHVIGALQPTSGEVKLFGASPKNAKIRARIGYLPEFPRLPDTLTPNELLRLHGQLAGLSIKDAKQKAKLLLERVELAHRSQDRIRGFSKGMQQKIALCLTLIGEPELLILDEPMSGLDPVGRRLVRDVIREQHQQGRTVFFSSHVLPDVESLCDEVAIISAGKLVGHGPLQELLEDENPRKEIVVRLKEGQNPPEAWNAWGKIETQGNRITLLLKPQLDALMIAQQLSSTGAEVLDVFTLRNTLEAHLVKVIEKSQRNEAISS